MLSMDLRNQLIAALAAVPISSSRAGRDQLLVNLPPNIVFGLSRFDDNAMADYSRLVSQLDALGRLTDSGVRPVVVLAQTALPYIEGSDPGRRLKEIIALLEKHYAGDPVMPPPTSTTPPVVTHSVSMPEAVLLGDQRVSFQFIERAMLAANSVARLLVPTSPGSVPGASSLGTAWLLTPELLITNHHVIAARQHGSALVSIDECRARTAKARAWFDYRIEGSHAVEWVCAELIWASDTLDYAIIRLPNGLGRPPLAIRRDEPALLQGDRLNIIQHAQGGPLKYAIRGNYYIGRGSDARFLRYLTDTEPGASGSPVFDDDWRVVALHHSVEPVAPQQHSGKTIYLNNEGISIHAIVADLPTDLRREIAAAQHWT